MATSKRPKSRSHPAPSLLQLRYLPSQPACQCLVYSEEPVREQMMQFDLGIIPLKKSSEEKERRTLTSINHDKLGISQLFSHSPLHGAGQTRALLSISPLRASLHGIRLTSKSASALNRRLIFILLFCSLERPAFVRCVLGKCGTLITSYQSTGGACNLLHAPAIPCSHIC